MFIMHSMKKRNTLKVMLLLTFEIYIRTQFETLIINVFQTEQERIQYDIKWKLYFNHLEKWILSPITEEIKDSELALWIYRCIGTLFLCTSIMLYSKVSVHNIILHNK